jgi:DNA-binding protein HU-beta
MAKARRTTHRSSKGTKLYAVRDAHGRFKDIQTYKRAQAADLRSTSKAEAASKVAARKTAKKK